MTSICNFNHKCQSLLNLIEMISILVSKTFKSIKLNKKFHQIKIARKLNAKYAGAQSKYQKFSFWTLVIVMEQLGIFITTVLNTGFSKNLREKRRSWIAVGALSHLHGKISNVNFVNKHIHSLSKIKAKNTDL
jgi:hypothetical protein